MIEIILTFIFVLAFITIALEETLSMNKAKSALFFGTLVWIILFIVGKFLGDASIIQKSFEESILEIAVLWLFLISAMTFIAYMDKRGYIENLMSKFIPQQISEKKLLFIIGVFVFFLSSIIDNLTATLIGITAVLAMNLEHKKLIKFGIFIVFAANAGGLWLITGDITTLMLFIAGKIKIADLFWMVIPAFLTFMVFYFIMSYGMKEQITIQKERKLPSKVDHFIAIIFVATIVSLILGNVVFGLPPTLVFLFGLSIMFLLGWAHKKRNQEDLQILDYIRSIEFEALFFFLGVLLLVGMLKEIGVLAKVIGIYTLLPVNISSFIVGIISAFVDNIPLTAAMIKSGIVMSEANWLTLNYCIGLGGSLLAIGSAAGVVAMSKVKGLTFGVWLKYTGYIFIAYIVGFILTWITSNIVISA